MKLSQRLKRLEAHSILEDSIPAVITIQYVGPNKEITGTHVIELDKRVQLSNKRPWRRSM
jgi:hypothetical protein